MATLYPDIKTNNWQISTAGVGVIAEGLADIRQCLDIILRTSKGSDPLRPEFGSDIFRYIDQPLNVAIPNAMKAIIEATEIWEKRVTIKKITWEIIDISHVKFFIVYSLVDEELIDLLVLYMNGGYLNYDPVDTGSLVLTGLFPPNPSGKRYNISFTANDNVITPLPPAGGFTTKEHLYNWVVANWGGYGTWQLAGEKLRLFANPTITSGSITISIIGTLRFATPVPNLALGESFKLIFVPDGTGIALPASFVSLGEMLDWVQANLSIYGTWTVEGNPYGPGDFDIGDFDEDDFDIGTPAAYILVLYSDTVSSCELEVIII